MISHKMESLVEINSSSQPGDELVHGENGQQGTTFTAMLKLGLAKGYSLVAHTGNMIFVRNDHIRKVGLPVTESENPEQLFITERINPTRLQVFRRKLRYTTP
jgi:hypothetical protein